MLVYCSVVFCEFVAHLDPNHDQNQNGGETQTTNTVECKTKPAVCASKCEADDRSTERDEADEDGPFNISKLGNIDGKERRDDSDDHEEG